MFPTHVGVNRLLPPRDQKRRCVPHACGGEPQDEPEEFCDELVFPTHVGVNRAEYGLPVNQESVFPTHVGVNRLN